MRETAEDVTALQAILDQSIENAGSYLRRSFGIPKHSLSAVQLIDYLQGHKTVAFASVTARGEPRVAPNDSIFYRGKFYITTVANAVRTKLVQHRPAVSLTCFEGTILAIIVHGTATVIAPDHPEFAAVDEVHREVLKKSILDFGEGVFLRVDAKRIYSFVREPEKVLN